MAAVFPAIPVRRPVAREGVRDLVAHHDGEAGLVLRERQDAGVHRDLPAGQGKRVRRLVLDQRELPLIVGPIRRGRDALADAADHVDRGLVLTQLRRRERLLVGRRAQAQLLARRDQYDLLPPRERHGLAGRGQQRERAAGGEHPTVEVRHDRFPPGC
jgi:hypothetical protein